MKWTFKLREKDVTLTGVENVAAVRPTVEARERSASPAQLVRSFGGAAIDTSRGGRFGLDLPSRNRKLFEQGGWVFVEPNSQVARAALLTRASVPEAAAVHQVFMDPGGNVHITTDVITIQVDPEMNEAQIQQRIQQDGLRLVRRITFAPNTFEVRARDQLPLPELVDALQAENTYAFAEPMFLQVITGRAMPTDPGFSNQWQHANDGSNGGVAGADIGSEQAWDLTLGRGPDRAVRLAVIDNGMQVRHPDLKSGIVGGGQFRSDGLGSATFQRLQADRRGFPGGHHGTFCLGIAGARANNGRGGCGSAPEADLLAVACLDDQIGSQTTLARAVAYAADPTHEDAQAEASEGADVIVCSLGPNGADWDLTSVLDLAIKFAAREGRGGRGIPIFWAVSNGFVAIARDEVCSHPDVIAVGRSSRNDLADDSAHGPQLEFLAPGVDVFSTTSNSRYGFDTGTSYAAPLAAGVGALVLARHPNWTAKQVRKRLRATCDKVGGVTYNRRGHHNEYGFGRINAARAVQ